MLLLLMLLLLLLLLLLLRVRQLMSLSWHRGAVLRRVPIVLALQICLWVSLEVLHRNPVLIQQLHLLLVVGIMQVLHLLLVAVEILIMLQAVRIALALRA